MGAFQNASKPEKHTTLFSVSRFALPPRQRFSSAYRFHQKNKKSCTWPECCEALAVQRGVNGSSKCPDRVDGDMEVSDGRFLFMRFMIPAWRGGAVLGAVMAVLGAGSLSFAQVLVVPKEIKGASDLTVAFDPPTAPGDQISFVFEAMNWEVYGGRLPENREMIHLAGPSDPGEYRIIWYSEDGEIRNESSLRVTDPEIWVNGPAVAKAGQGVLVEWFGPGFEGDSILLYRETDDMYLAEVMLKGENPVLLPLDVEPGEYEVLYWYDATKSIMVREWLTVE